MFFQGKPEVLNFVGSWTIFLKTISEGPLCYAVTSWTTSQNCFAHKQSHIILLNSEGYNFQERFINDLWKSLRTTNKFQMDTIGVHLDHTENHWGRLYDYNIKSSMRIRDTWRKWFG